MRRYWPYLLWVALCAGALAVVTHAVEGPTGSVYLDLSTSITDVGIVSTTKLEGSTTIGWGDQEEPDDSTVSRGLYQFDFSSIPGGARVVKMALHVREASAKGNWIATTRTAAVGRVMASFDADSVTSVTRDGVLNWAGTTLSSVRYLWHQDSTYVDTVYNSTAYY